MIIANFELAILKSITESIMKKNITIRCINNNTKKVVETGSTLSDIYPLMGLDMKYGPVSAKVNNKVEGMHYSLFHNKNVEFLDMHSTRAQRG